MHLSTKEDRAHVAAEIAEALRDSDLDCRTKAGRAAQAARIELALEAGFEAGIDAAAGRGEFPAGRDATFPLARPGRVPVGIAITDTPHGAKQAQVACADGSYWVRNRPDDWTEGQPIPGSQRAAELANLEEGFDTLDDEEMGDLVDDLNEDRGM